MKIENIYYDVLSRGEDYPERILQEGEIVYLNVRKQNIDEVELDEINTAKIQAEHVERLGHYNRVKGFVQIDEQDPLYGIGDYETEKNYPVGTLIGELILKNVTLD